MTDHLWPSGEPSQGAPCCAAFVSVCIDSKSLEVYVVADGLLTPKEVMLMPLHQQTLRQKHPNVYESKKV